MCPKQVKKDNTRSETCIILNMKLDKGESAVLMHLHSSDVINQVLLQVVTHKILPSTCSSWSFPQIYRSTGEWIIRLS